MMVPYIFSATIIALMSLGLNLYVIPRANAQRHVFEAQYTKKKAQAGERNIHYQIAPGQFVYVEQFSKYNKTAYKFTLETIEDNRLVSKLSADRAVWNESTGGWTLKKYFIREFNEGSIEDKVRCGDQLDTVISLTIKDFERKKNTVEDLDYKALKELEAVQTMRGDANVKYSQIEIHNRFSLPFSAFILTIM